MVSITSVLAVLPGEAGERFFSDYISYCVEYLRLMIRLLPIVLPNNIGEHRKFDSITVYPYYSLDDKIEMAEHLDTPPCFLYFRMLVLSYEREF